MKQKILVICPTKRDRCELSSPQVIGDIAIEFHDYDETSFERVLARNYDGEFEKSNPALIINQLLEFCDNNAITGVLSSDDYPGSIYASIIAQNKKFIAPSSAPILECQHKYYARCLQAKLVPEATPAFELINPNSFDPKTFSLPFPVFVKPVKAYFSFLANKIETVSELSNFVTKTGSMPTQFLYQFNWFLQNYSTIDMSGDYFIAEGFLHGQQVNVEGFVQDNACHVIGITDSIMFPGTISFSRFEYPSALPEGVQQRMADIAARFLIGINFNNSLFNIEMMYNPVTDEIHIIEVNPRFSSQFADLYEKVEGFNAYAVALAVATGKQPILPRAKGNYAMAASCVLRIFENKKVVKVPSSESIEKVKEAIPDIRIYIYTSEGELLSDQLQDGKSYRYGLMNIGGRDRQEIIEKFELAKRMLRFKFQDTLSNSCTSSSK